MSFSRRAITMMAVLVTLFCASALVGAQSIMPRDFTANLSRAPGANTQGTAVARFEFSRDGTVLSYSLKADNVYHPNYAALVLSTGNGDPAPVARLYPEMPSGYLDPVKEAPPILLNVGNDATYNGRLAVGTITSEDLIGPLAGKSLLDLANEIIAGRISVVIDSREFPNGAVSGQLS
jgi:hypothetical protein